MRLNKEGLINEKALWEAKGYTLPGYGREAVRKSTKENPFCSLPR